MTNTRVRDDLDARCEELSRDKTYANLYRMTMSYGDQVAARYLENNEEKAITYRQYDAMCRRYGARLRRLLGEENKGRYVGISLENCPQYLGVLWGLLLAGYRVLLVDVNASGDMTDYLLAQSDACAIVVGKVRPLKSRARQVELGELLAAAAAPDFTPTFGDRIALCTSGTTETSRIFCYDGEAMCNQCMSSLIVYHSNPRVIGELPTRNLAFLPFHHIFGFLACLLWMSFLGHEQIYLANRSPDCIRETSKRFGITFVTTVPLLVNSLCAALEKQVAKKSAMERLGFGALRALSLGLQSVFPHWGVDFARTVLFKSINSQLLGTDLRCIVLGGSKTPEHVMRTINALGYYTTSGFGMTETAITSIETTWSLSKRVSGAVGMPLSNIEYRILSDGNRMNVGEMLVRGACLHSGRVKDGKELPPDFDRDGWFHSGDVVRLEKGNRMYIEGRVKDIILGESGENIYPDEIENALGGLADAEQYTVLGVKNAAGYEDVTLVVNLGAKAGDENVVQRVLQTVKAANGKLGALRRIRRAFVTSSALPTSASMKIKRLAIKATLEGGHAAFRELEISGEADREPLAALHQEAQSARGEAVHSQRLEDLKAAVREIYAEALDVPADTVSPDAHFIDDLGGDSLQVLGMALKIEEKFGILIPTEEYGRCTTVADAANLLLELEEGGDKPHKDVRGETDVTPITRFEDTPEYAAFRKRIDGMMAEGGGNPYFIKHDSPILDRSYCDGKWVLNFSSYNYVGMSGRPETKQAAKDAIDQYGTSASGSRLLGGDKTLYAELEREIADWKHSEAALVLVGGHSTNVTCVGNFCGEGDLIVYDAIAHNSIGEGCRLSAAVSKPFPHNDTAALESILRTQRGKFKKVLIVIEGVYSMDGDIAPVPEIVRIKKKYGCFLMVDEAHSACVIGKTGGGVDEYFGLEPNDVDIKMGTLSKGTGTCGGYLAGSTAIIEYMRYNLPGFVFSVGISPPLAAATLEAIRLLRTEPKILEDLRRNIRCFVDEAHKRNLNTCLAGETAIIPILVGEDEQAFKLSNMLRERGVFVPPAVYPAVPRGKARLRFCVISDHQPDEIVQALDALMDCAKEAGITLPPTQTA